MMVIYGWHQQLITLTGKGKELTKLNIVYNLGSMICPIKGIQCENKFRKKKCTLDAKGVTLPHTLKNAIQYCLYSVEIALVDIYRSKTF
jgi:hypothetical protein